MGKVLIIDDEDSFLSLIRDHISGRFPGLTVLTCDDPVHCLASINTDLDLLLIDLEMPGLDGAKVLSYAVSKGIDRNRIIIFSGHDADYLHKRFPLGCCLGVLNKFEAKQQEVLDMIFSALQNRGSSAADAR
jgi:CheY-like chemotaxis protein